MPKKKPAGHVISLNGHTLVITYMPDGTRTFFCPDYPDLPARHNGTADATEAIREFEHRASGGGGAADDGTKGAA